MPVSNKRRAQAKAAKEKQLQASRAQSCTSSTPLEYSATTNDHPNNTHHPPFEPYVCPIRYPNDVHDDVHWEGLSESEEESDVEMSEPEDHVLDEGKNAFDTMMQAREGPENGTGGAVLCISEGQLSVRDKNDVNEPPTMNFVKPQSYTVNLLRNSFPPYLKTHLPPRFPRKNKENTQYTTWRRH